MAYNANPGYAFPLEKLGSDLSRNQYNYESILNALVEWNRTLDPEVRIRLSMDTSPWFQDYVIPSKHAIEGTNQYQCVIQGMYIPQDNFAIEEDSSTSATGCELQHATYGGERLIPRGMLSAATGVDIANDQVTLNTVEGFVVGYNVKFDLAEPTATLPTGIDVNTSYRILGISGNVLTLGNSTGGALSWGPGVGSGLLYVSQVVTQSPAVDPNNQGDVVTVRVSVEVSGNGVYEVWFAPQQLLWAEGQTYTYGNYVYYDNVLYKLKQNVYFATLPPDLDTLNYAVVYHAWVINTDYTSGTFCISTNGSLYLSTSPNSSSQIPPEGDPDNWKLYAKAWVNTDSYPSGSYVFDQTNGNPYVSVMDVMANTPRPSLNTTQWKRVLFFKFPTTPASGGSFTTSWRTWINIQEYVIRNVSPVTAALGTRIVLSVTSRGMTPPSIYQRTTGYFPSCNFAYWPDSINPAWIPGQKYVTDPTLPIDARQNYTAMMVFDHTRVGEVSTINWINYTGPDLDQGLAIYLPVLVETGPGTFSEPEDGFSFEFFFRIWPNTAYTDATTRDHIINKAQIYVYSAGTFGEIAQSVCSNAIAKFSMSRLTNFYMFGENVSIPDKPVCYKAEFAYNARTKQWITVDYYQLPDHLFVGPIGYIDPQNPANGDINPTYIGDIGPNPAFIGYETAGFPLFQDPFSNTDLTPVRFSTEEQLAQFRNRLIP